MSELYSEFNWKYLFKPKIIWIYKDRNINISKSKNKNKNQSEIDLKI